MLAEGLWDHRTVGPWDQGNLNPTSPILHRNAESFPDTVTLNSEATHLAGNRVVVSHVGGKKGLHQAVV